MEIGIVGSIRTPFGEVGLIPQDRNLLQASSVDPLQFGNLRIHLWAMLERIHEAWSISGLVEPVLLIEGSCQTSSFAGESIAAELMKPVTLLAGVEPLLQAPASTQNMLLSNWNMSSGGAEAVRRHDPSVLQSRGNSRYG